MSDKGPVIGSALVPNFGSDALVGRHSMGGDELPLGAACPNCNLPLTAMMNIDLCDDRLAVLRRTGIPKIPLIYCWRCNIPRGLLAYRLCSKFNVEIIDFKPGKECDAESDLFPYEGYPKYFPVRRFELCDAPPNCFDQESFDRPRHQIGGYPLVYQGLRDIKCRVCRRGMPFLATVADDAGNGWSFAANAYVQTVFHVCIADAVICAYHDL